MFSCCKNSKITKAEIFPFLTLLKLSEVEIWFCYSCAQKTLKKILFVLIKSAITPQVGSPVVLSAGHRPRLVLGSLLGLGKGTAERH